MTNATIAVMGISPLVEGEEGDAIASADLGDRLDISMPANQLRALRKLRKAGGKIVLVLTGGSPIAMAEAMELADAVLWVWYPGEAGGEAVADILFGAVAPSGRLPVTFPKSLDQLPPYADYGMQGRTYRYMKAEPLLPFGFGLSYTTFRYDEISLGKNRVGPDEKVTASVRLTNIGQRSAEEVVQVYLRWPDHPEAPLQALKSFQRVAIEPGDSAVVDFEIGPEQLALADENGNIAVRSGRIEVIAAGACPIPRSEALGAARPVSTMLTIQNSSPKS
jgi:beta-glucosidase